MDFWLEDLAALLTVLQRLSLLLAAELEAVYIGRYDLGLAGSICLCKSSRASEQRAVLPDMMPNTDSKAESCVYSKMQKLFNLQKLFNQKLEAAKTKACQICPKPAKAKRPLPSKLQDHASTLPYGW